MWHITTFDPRNPQYGAVWWRWAGEPGTLVPGELAAFSPYVKPYSCRVEPGDLVTFAGHGRVSDLRGGPQILIVLRFFTAGGSLFHASQGALNALGYTRTLYSHSVTAPAGSHYLRATFAFSGVGTEGTVVVVDSARLGIE